MKHVYCVPVYKKGWVGAPGISEGLGRLVNLLFSTSVSTLRKLIVIQKEYINRKIQGPHHISP
jgi:hypothetical protein